MNRLLFYDWRYYEILTESFLIISDKSIISLCVLCVLCGEPIFPIGNLCGVVRNYYSSTFARTIWFSDNSSGVP